MGKHLWRTDSHDPIDDSRWVTGFRIQSCRLCGIQRAQHNMSSSAVDELTITNALGWNDSWVAGYGVVYDPYTNEYSVPSCTGVMRTQPNTQIPLKYVKIFGIHYPYPYA